MKECCNPKNENTALLADFLRVISEENRLRIICLLKTGEKCVCKIWQVLDLPQNLISHHLKVLKDFQLLSSRKNGLNVYYSLNEDEFIKYQQMLEKILTKEGENNGC